MPDLETEEEAEKRIAKTSIPYKFNEIFRYKVDKFNEIFRDKEDKFDKFFKDKENKVNKLNH